MNKVVSLILALMMCLSLCACGGDNSRGSFLTKTEWKDVGDESTTYTFKKDGTGTYKKRDTTWELSENRLSVSYQGNGVITREFDVIENGTAKIIIECPNNFVGSDILVSADNYEAECKSTREFLLNTAEVLDWESVHAEIRENAARAAATYTGKIVKWTAKVYEIEDYYCQMATEQQGYMPVNAIKVEMSSKELIKFNKFDEITVVGILELDSSFSYRMTGAFVVEK